MTPPMTLDQWIELSPDERNARRRCWRTDDELGDGDEWHDLLAAAQERFEAAYGSHPVITHIGRSASLAWRHEPSILVTTALHHPQLIEELPDRFCTFRVAQSPILDIRDFYLRQWTVVLRELLGWTESQTRQWALRWEDGLNGRDGGWFNHEDSYYYALPTVIRESVPALAAPPGAPWGAGIPAKLESDLRDAIGRGASDPFATAPAGEPAPYDWDAARARVNAVLSEAGGRLPRG